MEQSRQSRKSWGLLRKRECLMPTWRGWLVLLSLLAIFGAIIALKIHPFLAVTKPLPGELLVVEGWATDDALAQAVVEFKRNHYQKLYVTGGPLEWGAPLSEYKTYAERGAAVLLKLGLTTNEVQAVPAPLIRQDRTYMSAVTLRKWLLEHGASPTRLHLMTEGPHARRSWLLFEKAFGGGVSVGITAIPVRDYDPKHWWRSSAGVRGVIGEALAYAYARLLFWPGAE
jgi:hypothetical protein